MLTIVLLAVLCSHLAGTTGPQRVQFDGEALTQLRLAADRAASAESYQDYELFNDYQCAIECVKDKQQCTAYTFDSATKICSLFHESNGAGNDGVAKMRSKLKSTACDQLKCKSDAVCVGEDEPRCMCLNGASTPDDCDHLEIGVWGEFSGWSACSSTCGEGYQQRQRDCLSADDRTKKISSEKCIGVRVEIQQCTIDSCPVYGPWTPWTPCSKFCGIGVKQRNRSCIPPGSTCGNYTYEQRACGEANCQRVVGIKETEAKKYPSKGYLAIREGDILCIAQSSNETAKHMADLVCKSIGSSRGAQYAIITPVGSDSTCYPGILCDGTETNFHECKYDRSQASVNTSDLYAIITRCIIDGGFTPWSDWSSCTKSCGTGEQTRTRTCTAPSPSIPEFESSLSNSPLVGLNCTGDYSQVKACNEQTC